MTGREMMKRALVLLGYTDSVGGISAEQKFRSRAITVLNAVYSDLYFINKHSGFEEITSLEDQIMLSERALQDIMPYGVAAMLAQSESAGDEQQLFMSIYNQKRLGLTSKDSVADVIPRPI